MGAAIAEDAKFGCAARFPDDEAEAEDGDGCRAGGIEVFDGGDGLPLVKEVEGGGAIV